jgi:hypothetical protein
MAVSAASSDLNMPILAQVALAKCKKYPYEVVFKSVMMHLMDSVTNENVFFRQFVMRMEHLYLKGSFRIHSTY